MINRKNTGIINCIMLLTILAATILTMVGCSMPNSANAYSKEIFAMDTIMVITGYGDQSKAAVDEAVKEIVRLDNLLSIGNDKSEISILNNDGIVEASEDTKALMAKAVEYGRRTDGAYDVTVYPVVKLWGFYDDKLSIPEKGSLDAAMELVDYNGININENTIRLADGQSVDLGGIAKGYTSSCIMEVFKKYDLDGGIVSLGGNVQCYGRKPDGSLWKCAIQDPFHPQEQGKYLGTLEIAGKAVVTSGSYERYLVDDATGDKYHHIFDPGTGRPAATGIVSVTIVSEDGTLADALSTALFVMGKDKAIEFWQNSGLSFDMIIAEEDETVSATEGIINSFNSKKVVNTIHRNG